MDHRMEERERKAAKRPSQENWPKEKGTVTLCPLRILDDDC